MVMARGTNKQSKEADRLRQTRIDVRGGWPGQTLFSGQAQVAQKS